MIQPERLQELATLLKNARVGVADELTKLYAAINSKPGLSGAAALTLTVALLQSMLAVPSQPELPQPTGD